MSYGFEMAGTNTSAVVAKVVPFKALGRAPGAEEMGLLAFASDQEDSIAIVVKSGAPHPAVAEVSAMGRDRSRLIHFGPEARRWIASVLTRGRVFVARAPASHVVNTTKAAGVMRPLASFYRTDRAECPADTLQCSGITSRQPALVVHWAPSALLCGFVTVIYRAVLGHRQSHYGAPLKGGI